MKNKNGYFRNALLLIQIFYHSTESQLRSVKVQ